MASPRPTIQHAKDEEKHPQEKNATKQMLMLAIGQFTRTFNSALKGKSATLPAGLKDYFNQLSKTNDDHGLYKLSVEMMEKAPAVLKICVAANFPRLMSDGYTDIFEYVNSDKRTYKELDTYAKTKVGKSIIKDAISFVNTLRKDIPHHVTRNSFS